MSSAGQSFVEHPSVPVAPRVAQSQPQSPTESAVIVVKPDLTDEQLADLYMARKDYREATFAYKKLADQNPQNPVYLNKLGIALHQQAALGAALKYYERASKVDPSYADAQNNIGTIWYQRKKFGKAIKAYQKAINIRGDMAVLHSNLAYAYFGDKKYQEAISSFREALSLDPQLFEHNGSRSGSILQDRSVGDRGRFYFLLAKSFAEAGNNERCVIYLRKAKDEGYKELSAIKSDPAFSAILRDPAIQEVLAPKALDSTQP
jgi:tetratricopeptide (TPR) repeat protein